MKYQVLFDPHKFTYQVAAHNGEIFSSREEAQHRAYILNELSKGMILDNQEKPFADEVLFKTAFEVFGEQNQLCVAMEECAELIKEISKCYRSGLITDGMAEEIADVQIMCRQLIHRFCLERQVYDIEKIKLKRLKDMLDTKSLSSD